MIKRNVWQVLQWLCLMTAVVMLVMLFALGDSSLATHTVRLTPPWDKCLHLSTYGVIAALLRFSGAIGNGFLIWLLLVGVGMADELHQVYIPGREANVLDLLADAVGIAMGIVLMDRLRRLIKVEGG